MPSTEPWDFASLERRFYLTRLPSTGPIDDRVLRQEVVVPADPAPSERGLLLTLALVRGFGALDFVPLHAAGLVPPAGRSGLLIIGPTGAGKTTLASALLRVGWKIASDDLLMLERSTMECRAYRRTVEPQIGWKPDGSRQKTSWDPAVETPGLFVPVFRPGALVFLGDRGPAATTLSSLPAADAFVRLLGAAEQRDEGTIHTIHRLAQCGPAFLAACGPDVLEAPREVSALVLSALGGALNLDRDAA